MDSWDILQPQFEEHLLAGNTDEALALARNALAQGVQPFDFFQECISPSLAHIGSMFEDLDIFLPELVTAAEVVEAVNVEVINPAIEASPTGQSTSSGKVLLATVQGDLHDIGKNMVALILKVNGFEVVDLGTNAAPIDIVAQAEAQQVDVIGLSALLTTCLPYAKDVVDFLEGKDIRDQYPVIIGGAATTPEYADDMGANGHGISAAEAVALCRSIVSTQT
jgi:methylmalonyl-CoA mutase cobalamin-binding domain/chain